MTFEFSSDGPISSDTVFCINTSATTKTAESDQEFLRSCGIATEDDM